MAAMIGMRFGIEQSVQIRKSETMRASQPFPIYGDVRNEGENCQDEKWPFKKACNDTNGKNDQTKKCCRNVF